MAEVLIEFEADVEGPDRRRYGARVCGREREDGLWEGWLEFTPLADGTALRTGRETTQPNRDDLVYWATGLTLAYIEGALERVLEPSLPRITTRQIRSEPAFQTPAGSEARPLLDPVAVYREGADILRAQLHALDDDQLRSIAVAAAAANRDRLTVANREELVSLIMLAAEKRAA